MKSIFLKNLSWMLAMVFVASCGNSPLLNHQTAPLHGARTRNAATPGTTSGTAAACPLEFPKEGLCASVKWDKDPEVMVMNAFTLKFWKKATGSASGPYVSPTHKVGFVMWMPEMGHPAHDKPKVEQVTSMGALVPGEYRVTNVRYNMDGLWDNKVQLQKDDGTLIEEAVFQFKL